MQVRQDLKRKTVDSRKNWFMKGYAIAIVVLIQQSYLYYFGLTILIIFLNAMFFGKISKKLNAPLLAKGDTDTMLWIFPSLVILGLYFPFIYLLVLFPLLATKILWVQKKHGAPTKTPGMPVLFAAFIITTIIYFIMPIN